jgi:hypothetical protein
MYTLVGRPATRGMPRALVEGCPGRARRRGALVPPGTAAGAAGAAAAAAAAGARGRRLSRAAVPNRAVAVRRRGPPPRAGAAATRP